MFRFLVAVALSFLLSVSTAFAQEAASEAPSDAPAATEDTLNRLIEVLEDDTARAALLDSLRAAETVAPEATAEEEQAAATPPLEELSFGRRIALVTQEASENIAESLSRTWAQLTRAPKVFDGLSGREGSVLLDALKDLALVIAVTLISYLLLRQVGKSIFARMSASARDGGLARAISLYLSSAVIDVMIVVAAWAAGYAITLLVLGDFGQIGIRQTLYLNAFLLVELAKVALRMVFSPAAPNLRPLPIANAPARYLNTRFGLIVSVAGYAQLLVIPIINSNVSRAAGQAISTLVAFAILAFAIWLVLGNRRAVTRWMLGETEGQGTGQAADPATDPEATEIVAPAPRPSRRRGALTYLARHWHWPALAYLFAMFLVVLLRPGDAAFRSFVASGQVVLVGLLGFALSGFITRAMVRGIVLPGGVSARVPLLERRLNTFVPKALFVLRLAIFAIVLLLAFNAIGLIDLRAWLVSQFGLRLTSMILSVAFILLLSFAVWLALTSWIDYRLNPEFGQVATARERTLLTLLRNAATIALIIITAMFVLSEIGLDIAPLLASAGVLGLAIGFGAQKMVQDIITGIFIQFENAMNVGDVVTVGGTTGTVERLTIRSVSLRDLHGVYHIIPFSSVDMVSNYVKDYGYFVCDMGVAYRESVEEVREAMLDAFRELVGDPERAVNILGELEWFGVQAFGDSAVVLRARIKCIPGTQWAT
ncbi:MAG: mechanosensitive ion channel, partial [Roseovarius sp.]